jgi:hypothetical protein
VFMCSCILVIFGCKFLSPSHVFICIQNLQHLHVLLGLGGVLGFILGFGLEVQGFILGEGDGYIVAWCGSDIEGGEKSSSMLWVFGDEVAQPLSPKTMHVMLTFPMSYCLAPFGRVMIV